MSSTVAGALVGAGGAVLAGPYLARLTRSVPDKATMAWWRGAPTGRRRVALTAAVGVVLGALAGTAAGWSAVLPAFVALALACAPLVVIDYEQHRLPNRLVVPAAAAGAVLLTVAAIPNDEWPALLRAAEGAAAVFAALFLLAFISPDGFGFGDVKLGGILGGYLGWFSWLDVYFGIFVGFLLGGLTSVVLLATGRATLRSAIPFGPMLVLGALIVLAFDLAR